MIELVPFAYGDVEVRTVLVDGDPWFVAADVARVLGYSATAAMTRRLDDEDKGVRVLHTPGGDQEMTVISEPGLYDAILGSQVSSAKQFKRWVITEVLPTIRRTGQFGSMVPTTFAQALELAAASQRQIELAERELALAAPKVEAYDALMDSEGYYSMEAAAKILGLGRTTFYRKLRDIGVIQPGSRMPYQRWMHHFVITAGYWTDNAGNNHPTETTRLRPSGLDWMRRRLVEHASA